MHHSPGFLRMVNDARPHVREITVTEARARLQQNPGAILVDVREDSEWDKGHAVEARHLGKGVLERDLETAIPDQKAELLMYCGGGYRSVLTAVAARQLGYHNAFSIVGGHKAMMAAGWPMKTGA